MSHEQRMHAPHTSVPRIEIETGIETLHPVDCDICEKPTTIVILSPYYIRGNTLIVQVHNAPGHYCEECGLQYRSHQVDLEAFRKMIKILKQHGETTAVTHYEELVARTLVFLGSPPDTQSAGR